MLCPAGRAHCAWGGHFVTCIPLRLTLPLVAVRYLAPTNGRILHLDLPGQVKKACKRPPHAQWARPAGHHYFAGGAVRAARSGVGRTAVLRWPAGSTERTAKTTLSLQTASLRLWAEPAEAESVQVGWSVSRQ